MAVSLTIDRSIGRPDWRCDLTHRSILFSLVSLTFWSEQWRSSCALVLASAMHMLPATVLLPALAWPALVHCSAACAFMNHHDLVYVQAEPAS